MKYIIDFDNSLSIAEVDQYLADNNITKIKQFGTFGHVFLAESAWLLEMAQTKFPEIKFHLKSEF